MKTDEHNCTLARGIEQTLIAAGVFLLGALSSRGQTGALPSPKHSGITHIVVVMMENRSFDLFLGWLPGADGQQAGAFLQQAAQTDRITNSTATSSLTTIWDRLASSGYTRRYYYVDLPFLALWGSKYLDIVKPFSTFLTD